jgi:hypothetical protein
MTIEYIFARSVCAITFYIDNHRRSSPHRSEFESSDGEEELIGKVKGVQIMRWVTRYHRDRNGQL